MELILIHITDIHIESEKDYEILATRTEFISNAINKHITNEDNTILLFCLTGDITYSGKDEQYFWASLLLCEIIQGIKQRHNNIFVQLVAVPGNHDCDFDRDDNAVRTSLLVNSQLDMSNPSIINTCTSIQDNFFSFIQDWDNNIGVIVGASRDNIFTINGLKYEDISLKFHCINTAWCSSINEEPKKMRLYIPDLEDKTSEDIVIVLMHHDESWLDWNSAEAWKQYYKHYADIILVGHDHVPEVVIKENYCAATNDFVKGNQLYSSSNPNQSGFNIIKINLESNIERFFTYEWDGSIYKNVLDTKGRPFKRNRYIKSGIELKPETLAYLDDNEIDIISKNKEVIKLSDIYVYPVLIEESISGKKSKRAYSGKDNIIKMIENKKFVIISGEKESGKTALIKQLYKVFFDKHKFPVKIDAMKLNTGDGEELNNIIAEFYSSQYNNLDSEVILQMDAEKKICVIDNFDDMVISDSTIKNVLKYLTCKFGIILITNSLQSDMRNFFKNMETKEFLQNNFTRVYIQDVKNYMRSKLVSKWLLLTDTTQNENSQEFDVLKTNKMSQVKNVMKSGFFNRTPIEFLMVLSYLDNYEKMNTDYSRHSYIYECLILDKINEMSEGDTDKATMYKTILEQLAFRAFSDIKNGDMEESFILGVIFDYNQDYRGTKGSSIDVIMNLCKHKVIEKKNSQYRFKNNYMYYYFAGSYIQNQLSPDQKKEETKKVFLNLSSEINFNIALFLAYGMSVEYEILPMIQEISQSLLKTFEDFRYEEQYDLIKKLEYDIDKIVEDRFKIPKNENIPELQNQKALKADELDESIDNTDTDLERDIDDEKLEQIQLDFNKTIRIIEFLGDILKNYSSSIKRKPRIDIISIMYNSSLRLLGAFHNMIEHMLDTIVNIVDEKVKEDSDGLIARSQFKQKINEYIGRFWRVIVGVTISNLGYSLQTERINDEMLDVKSEKNCTFFDIVTIDYYIRTHNGHLPIKDIENYVKGKCKKDAFSRSVLSDNVAFFLKNYQYDEKEKEIVCNLLGFTIKDYFIDSQKSKQLLDL